MGERGEGGDLDKKGKGTFKSCASTTVSTQKEKRD